MTEEETALAVIERAERPVLDGNRSGWEAVEKSQFNARFKRSLRHIACGDTFREAAQEEGYADHADLGKAAKKFGLTTASSERVVTRIRNVANLTMAELERRLEEAPEDIASKELAIIGGIATDKLAKKERWGAAGDRPEGERSALEQLADAASKGLISMDIHVRPVEKKESD